MENTYGKEYRTENKIDPRRSPIIETTVTILPGPPPSLQTRLKYLLQMTRKIDRKKCLHIERRDIDSLLGRWRCQKYLSKISVQNNLH